MKRICTCLLAAALVVGAFTGCAAKPAAGTDTTTKQEATTETTTVTTTENTKTTFRESYTSTIYPALHRKSGSGYGHELASYTTYYDAKNETRTANITASIRKLNNLVIPAGRTFSFNQTVGKRTVLAGYATAKVVQDGEFVDGLGGGVCQVSSTIFECILRANLTVVSRAPHSLEISYVPLGAEADSHQGRVGTGESPQDQRPRHREGEADAHITEARLHDYQPAHRRARPES